MFLLLLLVVVVGVVVGGGWRSGRGSGRLFGAVLPPPGMCCCGGVNCCIADELMMKTHKCSGKKEVRKRLADLNLNKAVHFNPICSSTAKSASTNNMDNHNNNSNNGGGSNNGGRKPPPSRTGRKRLHENSSGGGGGSNSANIFAGGDTSSTVRAVSSRSRQPQQHNNYNDLELLLIGGTEDGNSTAPQPQHAQTVQRPTGTENGRQMLAVNSASHGTPVDGALANVDGGGSGGVLAQRNVRNLNNNGGSGGVADATGALHAVALPAQQPLALTVSNALDNGGGIVQQPNGAVSGANVPMWSLNNSAATFAALMTAGGGDGSCAARPGGGTPSMVRGTVGGGLEALPPSVREAVALVHARQRQKMVNNNIQPEFASVVPAIGENGFSNLWWIYLEWQPDMVMNRVVGLVVLAGPFTTQTDISGYDVRIIFDHHDLEHEMAMHGWQECVPRMSNICAGQIVEFTRLKVRAQGHNAKGSFPFTLLYNAESRHRIVGQSSSAVVTSVFNPPSTNTPIIVEANDNNNNAISIPSGVISGSISQQGGNGLFGGGGSNVMAAPHQTDQQQRAGVSANAGSEQHRLVMQSDDDYDGEEQQDEQSRGSGGSDGGPAANFALSAGTDAPRTETGVSSTPWLSATRPPTPGPSASSTNAHARHNTQQQPRSSPPPVRACSITAQRSISAIVRQMNTNAAAVARDESRSRDRRRLRQLNAQPRQGRRLSTPRSSRGRNTLSPRPPHNVITIESDAEEEALGVAQQQPLADEDQHFYDDEMLLIEDQIAQGLVEGAANEVVMMGNHPLAAADRVWMIGTAFEMSTLPSSVKGIVEHDEAGRRNLMCCICQEWMVGGGQRVVRPSCGHFLHACCFEREAKLRRCNAWRQIGRGRPSFTDQSDHDSSSTNRSDHQQHVSGAPPMRDSREPAVPNLGSSSTSSASAAESANVAPSNDEADAGDADGQRLDHFCRVVGAWERTECRSRNTRCEAVEVSLRGWEGAHRPDTLLARCIAHLLQRVLSDRAPPMRIGMSCQPPQFASPYHIPHRAPEQNTAAAMGAELERLAAQSAGGVDLFGGTVLFRISAVWPLDASGQSGAGACAGDEQEARGTVRCRSFFPVVNPGDRWCLARAIVLGLADRRAQLQYGAGSVQAAAQFRAFWLAQHGPGGAQAARQLLHLATLPLDKQDYDVADAQRLQQALDTRLGAQQVRLVIFEREHGCRVLWKGAQRAHFNISLLLQQDAHYGYIQRPAQLFRAKQFCVECEHPVDRRTHPLGCRAVCGLCMRYDELRFPCRRQGGDGSSGTFCQHCRFVFPNADCFDAHRRRVDVPPAPPPGVAAAVPHGGEEAPGVYGDDAVSLAAAVGADVAPAFADRRRGRTHRSMCEERRLCEWCNVVVWARSGPHVCRRRPQQQQQQQQENRVILPQQQQQNHHHHQSSPPKCEKCGGPHDPERTPHFIQPKQYARQCQWRRGAARGAHDNADDGAVADAAVDDEHDDNDDVSEEEGAAAGAAHGGAGDGARGRVRKPKPVRFIFWDVECAQERVGEQQEQLEDEEAEAAHGADDEAGAMDAVQQQQQQQQLPELLKHVPVLVCAEVICERCVAYGVDIEREPLRRAPQCQCGVPWRGANRRRWCSRIGEEQFDDDDTGGQATAQQQQQHQQQQMPPDGLNPRRLRFFCDGEPGTGRGAMAQFVDFLLHTGPKGTRTVMLAHNGGRYDVHLLLEELQRRGERPKKAVQHGLRVYMLELRGTHQRQLICKDSLNFFHAALATLPRTFGLRGVLDKPFFPYHHIREQNLDVELPAGTLPPPAAYDPDRMRAAQRADFMTWYERELHRPGRQPFVLRRELLRYCWNDVRILRAACLRFRELVGECADGMEPFLAATTIASLAMAVFRQHHLRPHTMVHTPEGGFLRGRRASAESRRFFALLAAMRPDLGPLRTARWSVGEMVMDNSSWGGDDDGFRLDCVAYRRPPLRPLCIEFNGCYMHGCRECYPERQMVLAGGRSAELLWARTQQRAWELAELHGMQVQSVWECQFRRMLRNSPRMRKLYKERCVDVPVPLDLRKHALFGGRVEPFWLLYSCAPDEEIVYIDIVSLYPFCMKTRPFPIGTPRVWTGEQLWQQQPQTAGGHPHTDCAGPPPPALRPPALPWCRPEDNPFRGFLFCRVLPPSADELGDREPLLPYRTQADGRLTFGLCARCAELRHQRTCRHTERERAWTAAYTHVELNRALLLGYRVLQVHEVWHYDQWASPESGNGLFNDYVNTFLRLKAEASGWPAGCDDEAARAEHVRLFAEQEGVHLRHDNIGHNPGLRQLAKDLLNSLWGKMAERPERDEVVYTDSARAFHELLMDARQEVVSFTHINEQLDRCVVRKREPFARAPEHNNLAVACFVTSHARLYLYEWLEEVRRVGGRALYCDTDSVLYVRRLGAPCVREGNALGDMKRELPGRRIIDFFAAGPKNYGFQHVDARTGQDLRAERKVRSFELTYAADQQLQYGRMRQLVINHFGRPEQRANHGGVGGGGGDIAEAATEQRTIAVPCQRFVRSQQADIFTRRSTRVYRPVYTKGRVLRPPTAGGEAAAAEEQAEAVTPAPLFIRTRPFGWCSAEAQQMETDDDEEEEDEEAAAISDDDGGESDGMGQPVRKRARAEPVEEMLVEVEEQAAPPADPDLEEEPVAGCSTWNQQRRLNEHIFRN
ncbi:hypothetical protein niasHT_010676 [Heterodera trifolii]|uniref:DNA-directed DNA polymerase n=1 Tax=Heterodera trifolii TaxID=157864 RepID=A0ABD2LEJ4_9BILA